MSDLTGLQPAPPAGRDQLGDAARFESLTGEEHLAFPEYEELPPEPLGLAARWLEAATARGVREPRSLALATADADGRPSNRIVTVGRLDARGLAFTTHSTSRKGRDLAVNGWASGVLYWRETSQQLVLSGPVRKVTPAECDALWQARPVPLHSMTAASRQSEPLPEVSALRERARELGAPGLPLPRPDRFAGYLLEPAEVEFWLARPDRLHCRLHYVHDGARWHVGRLQP
ncbi:phenazine biosynthesis FMN-dependent oxidase PhzG [Streptomyces milbemycinicus]|uniref:Phenazine biosynthesis FMN-dependent oxidase PhzG n=1 Tax=Streptomyces milbemycinicus TaxID=476552 RepID=A0ABW8M2S4_9ACTN